MAEKITIDTIIEWLKDAVEHKRPVDAHTWVDAAQKMTVLLGDEHDKLFALEQQVAQAKSKHMDDGSTAAKANILVQGTDLYREMRTQRARIERVEEMVRIAKVQARLKNTEMGIL